MKTNNLIQEPHYDADATIASGVFKGAPGWAMAPQSFGLTLFGSPVLS